jgi:hypothetical protein
MATERMRPGPHWPSELSATEPVEAERPRLFLNSIPKAGAHLVERALTGLGCVRGQGPLGSATVIGRNQWSKGLTRGPWLTSDLVLVGIELPAPVKASWLRRRLDRVRPGRHLRGHAQHTGYLEALLRERNYRMIHVVRDPRDVVVSHAHYMLARSWHPFHRFYESLGDLKSRMEFSITGGRIAGVGYLASIAERYHLMEGWLRYPGALTVRFEDLVGRQGGGANDRQREALRRICDLAEIEPRSLDEVATSIFGESSTFRRGRIGGFSEVFDDRLSALFEDVWGSNNDVWGYGGSESSVLGLNS